MHEAERGPISEGQVDCHKTFHEVLETAERELGAFMAAVMESYGHEQAKLSAEDWLEELNSMDGVPGNTAREWRQVTIAASLRLAARVTASGNKTARLFFDAYSFALSIHCLLALGTCAHRSNGLSLRC